MKIIQINLGQKITIDDDDFERVSKHKWSTWFDKKRKFYACPKSTIKRKGIVLSRFLMNAKKGLQVDHINRNVLDNRKSNLRICTNSVNGHNRGLLKTNTTGFQGVSFDKYHKKYRSEIKINGVKKVLGYFSTPKEAYSAYKIEKDKYCPEGDV